MFRDGGYGTHMLVDKPEHLVDFSNVDPAQAATYACSGITACSAVRKLSDVEPDSPVVVIGAGGLGLAAINLLGADKNKTEIVRKSDIIEAGRIWIEALKVRAIGANARVIELSRQIRSGLPGAREAYLSPSAARKVRLSQDDGAETQSGLRADPGAVPGASTLAA